MSGTWLSGWIAGDVVTAAEYRKSAGAIFDSTLGAPAANIDITGIPSGYAHLRIVVFGRSDTATALVNLMLRLNNDAGTNYDSENLQATAAGTPAASESLGATEMLVGVVTGATATAGYFGQTAIDIAHYAATTGNKLAFGASFAKSANTTTNQFLSLRAGGWRTVNTAINRLTLFPSAGSFIAGTRVTVYAFGA